MVIKSSCVDIMQFKLLHAHIPHVKKRGERGTKRIVPRAMEDFCSPHSLAQWGTKLATFSYPAQKTSGCWNGAMAPSTACWELLVNLYRTFTV